MLSKSLLINLLLIFLILLGTWYTWLQLTQPLSIQMTERLPDAYATQVVISHFDATGKLHDELKTPFSVHYPNNREIFLSKPIFNLYSEDEIWQLSSNYGKLKQNNRFLQLWDDVILQQKKTDHQHPDTILKTSTLNINLKTKTADTSSPVTITQLNQEIYAKGLHADFKTKTIQLLSNVTGQLSPSR